MPHILALLSHPDLMPGLHECTRTLALDRARVHVKKTEESSIGGHG